MSRPEPSSPAARAVDTKGHGTVSDASADRVIIFDTTLRDGEQSPGASMTVPQKIQVAHALAELGVDVIEAGFAAASPGDLEAIREVAPAGPRSDRLQPRPLPQGGHRRRLGGAQGRAPPPLPRLPRHVADPPRLQAEDGEGRDHQALDRGGEVRAPVLRGRRVHRRGLGPHRAAVPGRGGPGGPRRRRDDHQRPRHRRLRAPVHLRRGDHLPQGARPRHREGRPVGPLPQRPRAGRRQLAGRRDGGRPAGRVHHQRDRRAGRQRLARGGRDGVQDAQGRPERHDRHQDRAALPDEPARLAGDRPARPAEQGDRRAERLRPRGRHPPARHADPPRDLRDHAPRGGRLHLASWCSASTPAATPSRSG